MPQQITEYKCLLISPGDVTAERDALTEVVQSWNAEIGRALTFVMLKPIVYNNRGRYRVYGPKCFPSPAEKLIETDPRLKWVVEDYSK